MCDKADFLIEMIESFFTEQELKQLIYDMCHNPDEQEIEVVWKPTSPDEVGNVFAYSNLICKLAVRWAIKHNIGPKTFSETMAEIGAAEYNNDIAIRRYQSIHGHKPTSVEAKEKLKDLES